MAYQDKKLRGGSSRGRPSPKVKVLAGIGPLKDVNKWPETTYRGHKLIDVYLGASDIFNEKLGIGDKWEEDIQQEDEEGEMGWDRVPVEIQGQESYLGYIPSTDTFIVGYDMWEITDNETTDTPAGMVHFKIDDKGQVIVMMTDTDYDSHMMYGERGALPKLHKTYPDLIDIRLD